MITVKFSCKLCGKEKQDCDVPDRKSTENVIEWMERIMPIIQARHWLLSPECQADKVDLMVPISQDQSRPIGSKL